MDWPNSDIPERKSPVQTSPVCSIAGVENASASLLWIPHLVHSTVNVSEQTTARLLVKPWKSASGRYTFIQKNEAEPEKKNSGIKCSSSDAMLRSQSAYFDAIVSIQSQSLRDVVICTWQIVFCSVIFGFVQNQVRNMNENGQCLSVLVKMLQIKIEYQ